MNTKRANEILEKVATEFSEFKEIPKHMAITLIRAPEIPCSKWTLSNQLLIGNTHDARGYYQWQSVGRYVKKGASARYILAPIEVIKHDDEKDEDYKIIVGFKAVPVFAIEDTSGTPVEEYKPASIPPLANLASITYVNSKNGRNGAYYPSSGKIELSTEDPTVYFHELMHKYDAKTNKIKGGQDPEQEIVAELGACVLAHMYDVEYNMDNHLSYIASYCGTKSPKIVGAVCLKMAERTMKAIQLILADAAKVS